MWATFAASLTVICSTAVRTDYVVQIRFDTGETLCYKKLNIFSTSSLRVRCQYRAGFVLQTAILLLLQFVVCSVAARRVVGSSSRNYVVHLFNVTVFRASFAAFPPHLDSSWKSLKIINSQ